MFSFNLPWLILLLPLPLLTWLILPASKKSNDGDLPEVNFPYVERLKAAFGGKHLQQPKSKKWFVVILSLLWALLVLSVMSPIWIDKSYPIQKKGYDIMLAVDISLSMNVIDMTSKNEPTTRLDATKQVITKFVERRIGDRLGLILFGEYAYLQVPMTFDTLSLSMMLNKAVAGMAGGSTAIGDAIGLAVRQLRDRPNDSRILILLTDGSDNSSSISPTQAAKIAAQYNIRIYTIGIGSQGMVPYPDPATQKIVMIPSIIDEKLLQNIASITGGEYFSAKDSKTLDNIYNKINELEKIDLTTVEYQYISLYKYPLGVACLLFLILCLFPLRKRFTYGT